MFRPDVHGAFAPLNNNDLWRRGDKIKEPPGAKENPGAAATVPGLDAKSELAIGRKILSLNWGVSQ